VFTTPSPQKLSCRVLSANEVHPQLFKGANRSVGFDPELVNLSYLLVAVTLDTGFLALLVQ
jgi:hypothetical protein